MKKNYTRWGCLVASLPFLMLFIGTIFGIIDDCPGLEFACVAEVIFDDFIQIIFMLFLGVIGIVLLLIFIISIKVKPELVELKLKKIKLESPTLILVFEDPFVSEILYFVSEEEKDKYETGKYYKVMKTKTKIYDVLD